MTFAVSVAHLAGDVELPYVEHGSPAGVPVVLLHAYADSWRSFERVLPLLLQTMRVVVPTQRGHGDASKPERGYEVRDFAANLVELLDELAIDRAVLVASSSAVFTAEVVASEHPDRVRGLVGIGVPWSLSERAPGFEFVQTIAGLSDPVDPAFVRAFAEGTTSERVPRDLLEVLVTESQKLPARVWQQTLDGLLAASPPTDGAITVPMLVIWGDRDELIPLEDQERLVAAVPGSRLVVYEGAGHVVHLEQPERVAHDITAFAASLPP